MFYFAGQKAKPASIGQMFYIYVKNNAKQFNKGAIIIHHI